MDRPARVGDPLGHIWLRTRAKESGCHPQGLQRDPDAGALLTTLTPSLAHLVLCFSFNELVGKGTSKACLPFPSLHTPKFRESEKARSSKHPTPPQAGWS